MNPVGTTSGTGWEGLLRAATVALEVPLGGGLSLGTGFFVAPGVVATCAHVIADSAAALPARVRARAVALGYDMELEPVAQWYFREPDGLDLAFLRLVQTDTPKVPDAAEAVSPVLLSSRVEVGDVLWTYGHPDGMFRAGQSATFTYQGTSRRSVLTPFELLRVKGTRVGGGFSGSAVINRRTGAVCGMLCTSDQAGSAHMVPAAVVLDICSPARQAHATTEAHRAWLRLLTDSQLGAGGWCFPGHQLRRYLKAAARAARSHPYPVVKSGSVPPLSTVYVPQRVEEQERDAADGAAWVPVPGDDALAHETLLSLDRDSVLVGGPGAGKSSLLRFVTSTLAERWLSGETCPLVPVLVPAAELVGNRTLADAIAAAVRADLSKSGLTEAWPAGFFRDRPVAGARWLVLVDGLDEVVGANRRRDVLEKLAGFLRNVHDGDLGADQDPVAVTHRFVVATRPVPEVEPAVMSTWTVRRYELLPFAPEQLPAFAADWFAARGVDEPGRTANRFAAQIERLGLTALIRVPLIATMLCQLFAEEPSKPLPANRYALYDRYVNLVRERRFEGAEGIVPQARAAVRNYGTVISQAVEDLYLGAFEYIAEFALARHTGQTVHAVDLLAARFVQPESQLRRVSDTVLRNLVRDVLRRSGLLVEHGDNFDFLHQSLGEFLAAQHVADDDDRSADVFRAVFGRGGAARPPLAGQDNDSFSRFLIAAWQGRRDVAKVLLRWAADPRGASYVAALTADGVVLDPEVTRTAAATLRAATEPGRSSLARLRAADALALLGDPHHVEAFAQLATGADTHEVQVRLRAAHSLAAVEDQRGSAALVALASSPSLRVEDRQQAAAKLERLGDPLYNDALAALAEDASVDDFNRLWAAEALGRLGDPRGAEALAALAPDPGLGGSVCLEAAEALGRLGDPRGADALTSVALMADTDFVCLEAAGALGRLGDARCADALAVPAARGNVTAAEVLVALGDPRGMEALVNGADKGDIAAAEVLATLGDARGLETLARCARGPAPVATRASVGLHRPWPSESDDEERRWSRPSGDGRAVDALAALANLASEGASAVDAATLFRRAYGSDAVQAVQALARLGDPRGVETLTSLLTRVSPDPDSASDLRLRKFLHYFEMERVVEDRGSSTRSVWRTVWHGLAVRGTKELVALAAEANPPGGRVSVWVRAAEALAASGDVRGVIALAALAAGSAPSGGRLSPRVRAGETLMALGDARGADILASLTDLVGHANAPVTSHATGLATWPLQTHDTADPREAEAVQAAAALARLGDPRGVEALVAGTVRRDTAAAEALAELGDPRGPEALFTLATEPGLTSSTRFRRIQTLEDLGDLRGRDALFATATDRGLVTRPDAHPDDAYLTRPARSRGWRADAASVLSIRFDPDSPFDLGHVHPSVDGIRSARVRAAEKLAALGDTRARDALAALATGSAPGRILNVFARLRATMALWETGEQEYADALAAAPLRRRVVWGPLWSVGVWMRRCQHDYHRVDKCNDSDGLAALVVAPGLNPFLRAFAAVKLEEMGDSRYADMAASAPLTRRVLWASCVRLRRFQHQLIRVDECDDADGLAALVAAPGLNVFARAAAAAKLDEMGDSRYADMAASAPLTRRVLWALAARLL
ncbi:trypsin-like peptidase domain-containing protein [Streptomyces sp. Ag109_G2-15]|uniref:trypsin-like peptidase domain-containing protein n=1 Tax=Streptomyces sp. Ag109_G2-15 TaxID=1938850 RepID=UPI0015CF0E36|nr:trypsin-like peptidase domain-containing protein [Streptomyces sp. Ag109_G2-15]